MFRTEEYSSRYLDALVELVTAQADYHEEEFTGDPKKLDRELLDEKSHTKCHLIFHESSEEPIGYIIHHDSIRADGTKATYLEDIIVHPEFREKIRGAGIAGMKKLLGIADDNNSGNIHLAVAKDNDPAQGLYNKFDLTEDTVCMRTLSNKDVFNTISGAETENCRSFRITDSISKMIITGKDNRPLVEARITNNFSTFSTQMGIHVEPKFPENATIEGMVDALKQLNDNAMAFAKRKNSMSHVIWLLPQIPELDEALKDLGYKNYTMKNGVEMLAFDKNHPSPEVKEAEFQAKEAIANDETLDLLAVS